MTMKLGFAFSFSPLKAVNDIKMTMPSNRKLTGENMNRCVFIVLECFGRYVIEFSEFIDYSSLNRDVWLEPFYYQDQTC